MSNQSSDISAEIHALAAEVGASACGIVRAEAVDPEADNLYARWIGAGCHGSMDYCARYQDVRHDPRLLLPGARTLIVCAFNYYNPTPASVNHRPRTSLSTGPKDSQNRLPISCYAWGMDYHHVLKSRLRRLATALTKRHGGECRVTVDTAPLRERYWAQRAGLGFIGVNNQLIVPGVGSYVFLGEVLWTGDATPDIPFTPHTTPDIPCTPHATPEASCSGCMACVKACPGHALDGHGGCDARRCVSYLTIEHRGDLPADAHLGGSCYGCDICQQVCPHNADATPTDIPEFAPDPAILSLTPDDLRAMTPSHFRCLTRHSAIQRITLPQLLRNLDHQHPKPKTKSKTQS